MRWFDQVLAVPLLGAQTAPVFWTAHTIFSSLQPMVEGWIREGGFEVVVEAPGPMVVKIARSDGYSIEVSTDSLSAQFAYKGVIKEMPGKTAQLTYTRTVPCSTLVEGCRDLVERSLELLLGASAITVLRTGLVIDARVEESALPPGLEAWRNYLAEGAVDETFVLNATRGVNLSKADAHTDRCIHTIDIDRVTRREDARLRFDWQRVNTKPAALRREKSRGALKAFTEEAMGYIDDFGTGSLASE